MWNCYYTLKGTNRPLFSVWKRSAVNKLHSLVILKGKKFCNLNNSSVHGLNQKYCYFQHHCTYCSYSHKCLAYLVLTRNFPKLSFVVTGCKLIAVDIKSRVILFFLIQAFESFIFLIYENKLSRHQGKSTRMSQFSLMRTLCSYSMAII